MPSAICLLLGITHYLLVQSWLNRVPGIHSQTPNLGFLSNASHVQNNLYRFYTSLWRRV